MRGHRGRQGGRGRATDRRRVAARWFARPARTGTTSLRLDRPGACARTSERNCVIRACLGGRGLWRLLCTIPTDWPLHVKSPLQGDYLNSSEINLVVASKGASEPCGNTRGNDLRCSWKLLGCLELARDCLEATWQVKTWEDRLPEREVRGQQPIGGRHRPEHQPVNSQRSRSKSDNQDQSQNQDEEHVISIRHHHHHHHHRHRRHRPHRHHRCASAYWRRHDGVQNARAMRN